MKYDSLCVASLRAMAIDMINKAKSGHPGMALDAAPLLYVLYSRHLVADPSHPDWIRRDRFVLSAGHASALLYSMLNMAGYKVSLDDLKSFRQWGSITPGHPEVGLTPGVDCSAGPLGQGLGQAVGMAIAERHLQAIYPGSQPLFSHFTYCLVGDGCLEEGVSSEATALAGKLKLNKLIVIYDANQSTLDGPTAWSSEENVPERFQALNWNVIEVADGNDIEALDRAIVKAKASADKPTLIVMHTLIGYGSHYQGTSKTHGAPLGQEDGDFAKASYGWDYPPFTVPEECYEQLRHTFGLRGAAAYADFLAAKEAYFKNHTEDANFLDDTLNGNYAPHVYKSAPVFSADAPIATRNVSGQMLNLVQTELKNLIGGSADVASSVKTDIKGGLTFSPECPAGTVMRYGIREFGMGVIANGMALHGGLKTYCGSFLVFSDYMKASIRMAAMQHLPVIYLFSHDSLAVGEDGPTHQPIEQLAMLRSIPNLRVFRPADATETAAAWRLAALSQTTPTALILTRQAVPLLPNASEAGVAKGGYVISKEKNRADLTLVASGSEVSLAYQAQQALLGDDIDVRVVSLPEMNLFLSQPKEYQDSVYGNPWEKRLVVEMASPYGLGGLGEHVMGVDRFGRSAPAKDVLSHYGFTVQGVVDKVKAILGKND